jgi:Cu(I)/Ag(I) efflux system membrane fusion protein
MTRNRKAAIASVAAIIVACVLALVIVHRRAGRVGSADRAATTSRSSGSGMQGMSGMSGMNPPNDGSVALTPGQLTQFGVTFGTAQVRRLVADTRATGVVTVDETRVTQVSPKFGGFIDRLYVNATGQDVRTGQPLLDIYSPDLLAAEHELLLAVNLQRTMGRSAVPGVPENSADLVDAAKRRLSLWDVSEAQIAQILQTGRVRRTLTVYAPSTGVVIQKNVVQGQATSAGESLYTIANLSDVWIDVQLREAEASAVRVGSSADVAVDALPGRTLKGTVTFVYPTLDSASRSLRARVVVSNPNRLLKPGMYARVQLRTPSLSVLTVPASAVLRTGARDLVFVDIGGGRLMPREVNLGRTAGDYIEVLSGLSAGQRVVTSAQYLLDSESNLSEVMKSMISQGR